MMNNTVEVNEYNKTKSWFLDGTLHREDGPAIEYANGTKWWWLNGKRHRKDGPAYEDANGTKCWYINGKLHREDGPAHEDANGTKYWYLNGKGLTEAEFNLEMKKTIVIDGITYKLVKL